VLLAVFSFGAYARGRQIVVAGAVLAVGVGTAVLSVAWDWGLAGRELVTFPEPAPS
jgi:hypothetical protein